MNIGEIIEKNKLENGKIGNSCQTMSEELTYIGNSDKTGKTLAL